MGLTLHQGHGHSHGDDSKSEEEEEEGKEESGGHGHSHSQNINVRAAFIHVLGDLVQSIGVLIASILIWYNPDWAIADPICTFIFSVLVLVTTIGILRDSLHVLMEGKSAINFNFIFSIFVIFLKKSFNFPNNIMSREKSKFHILLTYPSLFSFNFYLIIKTTTYRCSKGN